MNRLLAAVEGGTAHSGKCEYMGWVGGSGAVSRRGKTRIASGGHLPRMQIKRQADAHAVVSARFAVSAMSLKR